ncbi:MAG: site-specific DNA-methyltransferase, partial [Myxococcales bacterium]|nr:site-specific DNA-methyltransferase [Myxococcales bacterium]
AYVLGRERPPSAPEPIASGSIRVHLGDNLDVLPSLAPGSFRLIYVDPPFNTGYDQKRRRMRTVRDDEHGDRVGFKGQRYRTTILDSKSFTDRFDDYLGFLAPRLEQARRLLCDDGSLFVHLDYREVHYSKVLLDDLFGRECFINEIIWAYDYGARSKRKWSAKHDSILWYVKDPRRYVFDYEAMDRIPYMAPGLVGKKKAARGKTPTDVWWHTIVSPGGRERTGYPTQKPKGVVRRIVEVHSEPGDALLDFFAGSGTLGEVGAELGRDVTLIDENPEAIAVMRARLARFAPITFIGVDAEVSGELAQDLSQQLGPGAGVDDAVQLGLAEALVDERVEQRGELLPAEGGHEHAATLGAGREQRVEALAGAAVEAALAEDRVAPVLEQVDEGAHVDEGAGVHGLGGPAPVRPAGPLGEDPGSGPAGRELEGQGAPGPGHGDQA